MAKKRDIKIKTNININIIAISAKKLNKKRSFKVKRDIFYKNPIDLVNLPRVNIVFELVGYSGGISKKVVETALKNKKHVITANKALIAKHGDNLSFLAEKNKVNLSRRHFLRTATAASLGFAGLQQLFDASAHGQVPKASE